MQCLQSLLPLHKWIETEGKIVENLLNVLCKLLNSLNVFVHLGSSLLKSRSQVTVRSRQLIEIIPHGVLKLIEVPRPLRRSWKAKLPTYLIDRIGAFGHHTFACLDFLCCLFRVITFFTHVWHLLIVYAPELPNLLVGSMASLVKLQARFIQKHHFALEHWNRECFMYYHWRLLRHKRCRHSRLPLLLHQVRLAFLRLEVWVLLRAHLGSSLPAFRA